MSEQRERFEAWFSDQGKWPQAVERRGDGYRLMQANEAWRNWQAACPEGWQVVPKEPTIDMIELGSCHVMRGQDYERAQACWRAMLAAAPKSEDV